MKKICIIKSIIIDTITLTSILGILILTPITMEINMKIIDSGMGSIFNYIFGYGLIFLFSVIIIFITMICIVVGIIDYIDYLKYKCR